MASIVGCRLTSRGVLRLSGRDARTLLQSLVTADVAVGAGAAAPTPPPLVVSALLNRRGRVAFDAFVATPVRDGDGDDPTALYMDVAAARAADAVAHLRRHRVRARVAVEDVSASVGVYVAAGACGGDDALSLLTARPAGAGEAVAVDPRLPALGVRAVATMDAPPLVRGIVPDGSGGGGGGDGGGGRGAGPPPSAFAVPLMDSETAWTLLRMLHGVPEGAADFPPPRDGAAPATAGDGAAATGAASADAGRLPLEMGLDRLGAISFSKGCYLGQELTARSYHTGVTRRRLAPLLLLPPSLTTGVPAAALDADLRAAMAEAAAAAAAEAARPPRPNPGGAAMAVAMVGAPPPPPPRGGPTGSAPPSSTRSSRWTARGRPWTWTPSTRRPPWALAGGCLTGLSMTCATQRAPTPTAAASLPPAAHSRRTCSPPASTTCTCAAGGRL